MAARANDPLTFNRSTMVDGVMSFILGISAISRSYEGLSKRTMFSALSRALPFDHFYIDMFHLTLITRTKYMRHALTFFLPLPPPAMAALALASFVFCSFFAYNRTNNSEIFLVDEHTIDNATAGQMRR